MVVFPHFNFWVNRPEKCVLRYSKRKKLLSKLNYINKKLKQSKNWIFLKGLVHGFGQKLVIYPHFYFRENRPEEFVLNQKSVFYDIVEGRNAFLDYRNKNLKKLKNWDFS